MVARGVVGLRHNQGCLRPGPFLTARPFRGRLSTREFG